MLLRLLTCHSPTHPPLPTLLKARELFSSHLARAPKAQTVQTKHLLQRAVGMDSNAFLRHVYEGSIAAYAIPPALASFLTHLVQVKATLQVMIQQGIPFYQPDARVNNRNWATFALEAAESFVMRKGSLQCSRTAQAQCFGYMTGCTSKIETQFHLSSKGLLKHWFSSSRWGSTVIHRSHLTRNLLAYKMSLLLPPRRVNLMRQLMR